MCEKHHPLSLNVMHDAPYVEVSKLFLKRSYNNDVLEGLIKAMYMYLSFSKARAS